MAARRLRLAALAALGWALGAGAMAGAESLADELRGRWLGAWVVLRAEVGTDCDDRFTNNKVVDGRTVHNADITLPAGELAKVVKLEVKQARIDAFVEIVEPWRASRIEGPFELFEQLGCRAELQVIAPRQVIRKADGAAAAELLGRILERHESRSSASGSALWNRRRVEPLPPGYEETLSEYGQWRETRLVVDLHSRLDRALDEAADIIYRARHSEDYALGLAAGLGRRRSTSLGADCERLVDAGFYPSSASAPEDLDKRDWEAGYRDGQRLAFSIDLADRLEVCLR